MYGVVSPDVARLTADGVEVEIIEACGLRVWSLGVVSESPELTACDESGTNIGNTAYVGPAYTHGEDTSPVLVPAPSRRFAAPVVTGGSATTRG